MNKRLVRYALLALVSLLSPIACYDKFVNSRIDISDCAQKAGEATSAESGGERSTSLVRERLLDKGYGIQELNGNDPRLNPELLAEDFSLVWIASKKYGPSVVMARSDKRSTVRIFDREGLLPQRSLGEELTDELLLALVSSCGSDNAKLIKKIANISQQPAEAWILASVFSPNSPIRCNASGSFSFSLRTRCSSD